VREYPEPSAPSNSLADDSASFRSLEFSEEVGLCEIFLLFKIIQFVVLLKLEQEKITF
jgi:hypothetical protein